MTAELTEQIAMRIKEHMYFTERKPTDFVKGRRNEIDVFGKQIASHDKVATMLEKDNLDLLKAGDRGQDESSGFDKEAYLQIKSEIKRRREAKARLLEQGFPELRSYVTI